MKRTCGTIRILVTLAAAWCCESALAQLIPTERPEQARGIDIVERLGEPAPMDVELIDAAGETVRFGDYFREARPVLLALVYYDCPVICPVTLSNIQQTLKGIDHDVGTDYAMVVVSFDPTNTTEMSAEAQQSFFAGYGRPVTPEMLKGAAFHTARQDQIDRLTEGVGFRAKYLPDVDEYSHPAALIVLMPDGRVSRYLYGVKHEPQQVKLALLEASEGKSARSIGDHVLLFCYSWDPDAGAYVRQAMTVMRIGGAVSVVAVGGLIGVLIWAERRRRGRAAGSVIAGTKTTRASKAPGRPARA